MKRNDPEKIQELPPVPNITYVADSHGHGWYCTGVDEEQSPDSGECTHEDAIVNDRSS